MRGKNVREYDGTVWLRNLVIIFVCVNEWMHEWLGVNEKNNYQGEYMRASGWEGLIDQMRDIDYGDKWSSDSVCATSNEWK